VSVPRARSSDYARVAENFYKGAELAREFEYWNAAGVLAVHAAIALADAVAIKLGGVKSQGEDHQDSAALLEELIAPGPQKQTALNQLRRIIDHKTAVSYGGELYDQKDVEQLWKLLIRFRSWGTEILG
jgi:hypothetical protein